MGQHFSKMIEDIVSSKPHFQVIFSVMMSCCIGCASGPQQIGSAPAVSDVTIVQGKPNRIADGIGYAVGLPARLLTLHPAVSNHQFSDATRRQLVTYLKDNEIADVYVRVNQYDPVGEWHRLRENLQISPGWKYTVGLLPLAGYTLVPGRIFGGDMYNPFTNSLSINSDIAAVALHEAAYAKDVRRRQFSGIYAALNELPFASVWRHVQGVNDVVAYARENDDWEMERETYRVVYPLIGMHLASGGLHSVLGTEPLEGMFFAPLLPMGGAIAGHAAGEIAVARRQHAMGLDLYEKSRDEAIRPHTDEF